MGLYNLYRYTAPFFLKSVYILLSVLLRVIFEENINRLQHEFPAKFKVSLFFLPAE